MKNVKEEVVKYELEEGLFKPKGHNLFATVDEKRRVLSIKSSCFDTPSEDDIIFDTGFGDEYVHVAIKYPNLVNEDNTHIYFIDEENNIREISQQGREQELREIEQRKLQEIDIDNLKKTKIQDSKVKLALWLADNPLAVDIKKRGKLGLYAVTAEKQDELNKMIKLKESADELGIAFVTTWNEVGKTCEPYTMIELKQLALIIAAYVYPQIEKQRIYEVEVTECEKIEDLVALEVDFNGYVFDLEKAMNFKQAEEPKAE